MSKMKSNEEILNEFGKIVIKDVFDDNYRYFKQILSGTTKWGTGKEYLPFFIAQCFGDKGKE